MSLFNDMKAGLEEALVHEELRRNKRWRNADGELHREDGPAVEYADGGREWWVNGEELTETEHAELSRQTGGKE